MELFVAFCKIVVKVESAFPVVNVAMEPWIAPTVVTRLIVVSVHNMSNVKNIFRVYLTNNTMRGTRSFICY